MSGFNSETLKQVLGRHTVPIDTAIETGTFEGDTTWILSRAFHVVHTIELQPARWRRAIAELNWANCHFHIGNSAMIIPLLAEAYDDVPVLWYLDAHWWDEKLGARGKWGLPVSKSAPFPLWIELGAIRFRHQADIVIIDDVHAFGRKGSEWEGVSPETIKAELGTRRMKAEQIGDHYVLWLDKTIPYRHTVPTT